MPAFQCDLTQATIAFPHFWEHTIGSSHAPMALRADWQAQLKKCHEELGFEHVRFHGLLSDDMGTLICQNDELLYSFFNTDQIFDFLLSIRMRPFVELSFMPWTLASGDSMVFDYKANVTPPKDYNQWSTLILKLVQHWVERYGLAEVRHWYFEVWNEPNLTAFGSGKQADYFTLYRYNATAVKAVDHGLRVGGPATAKNAWIPEFLAFCRQENAPIDFVTTHHYPTDAFGEPGDDTVTQLAKSQRSILFEEAKTAHQQAQGYPLYYTEWSSSSNSRDPYHDEPYAAAFVTKTIMEARGLVDGYSYWTFSDIFAENYFSSVPFHGGFGLLNLYGIAKPTYRAFQLLHQLGTELLSVEGQHATVDVWAVRDPKGIRILLTNFALPRHPIETEPVQIRLTNGMPPQQVTLMRIDEQHANPRALWQQMGKPESLNVKQVTDLHAASVIESQPHAFQYQADKQTIQLEVTLPPLAVAMLTLEFTP